jgi:hypothetical protein
MKTSVYELRETLRNKLYSLPPTAECEVPIAVFALRFAADRMCTDWAELQHPADFLDELANELEKLMETP